MANIIIRKEKIKIHTSDERVALQVRRLLNDTLQYDLMAMIERVFAQTASSEHYINIDKIQVNIGAISVQDFEKHFIKLVESKFINELRKQAQFDVEGVFINTNSNGYYHNNVDSNTTTSSHYKSVKQQELTALMYFLQNGIYPWWYNKEIQRTPAQLLENLTEDESRTLVFKILNSHKNRRKEEIKNTIQRLYIHLSPTQYESFINQIISLYNNPNLSNNANELLHSKAALIQLFSISLKAFFSQLFQFLITGNIQKEDNIVYNFLLQLKDELNISVSQLQNKIAASKGFNSKIIHELKKILETDKENLIKAKPEEAKQVKSSNTEQEQEGIYIVNTGLLLLHPFLPLFFKEAELINDKNQFISLATQQKAAVLLYYLQCGDEQYKEWEMALNKILCGMASDEIIPEGILINEKEKEESNILLQTVVNYWEALKGASIEALQNSFLLREGKITRKEDHWLVQVERTGVDILLDRLPWGFSTIKLPWLDKLIYTEW